METDGIGPKRPVDAVTPDLPERRAPRRERRTAGAPPPTDDEREDAPAPRAGRLDVHA